MIVVRPSGVLVCDQKLLVMRYQYGGRDRFNLPGGNLESNEDIRSCLFREFNEELGLKVVSEDLLAAVETFIGDRYVLHLVFPIRSYTGQPCLNPQYTKALELLWLTSKELEEAPLYPAIGIGLARWMEKGVLGGGVFRGRISQPWFDNKPTL
ncbi:MAG: NUDIX hydrolase [Magnetococcus sp. DMHC-6]